MIHRIRWSGLALLALTGLVALLLAAGCPRSADQGPGTPNAQPAMPNVPVPREQPMGEAGVEPMDPDAPRSLGSAASLERHSTVPSPGGNPLDKATTCLSNVRQLNTALLSYCQDYDERYPPDVAPWPDQIYPYCRNRSIFSCPSASVVPSYDMNHAVRGAKLGHVQAPAEAIALFETDDGSTLVARHDGELTIGYIDGHADLVDIDTIADEWWTTGLDATLTDGFVWPGTEPATDTAAP